MCHRQCVLKVMVNLMRQSWLGCQTIESQHQVVDLGDNTTVRLDLDNEPQPDALLRLESGGRSQISEDDYIEGAPELIVEIAASSANYVLHDKKTGIPPQWNSKVHCMADF